MSKFHQFLLCICQSHVKRCRQVGVWSEPRWFRTACRLEAMFRPGRGMRRWIGLLPGLLMVATCVVIFVFLTRGPATTGGRKVASSTPARTGLAPVGPGLVPRSFMESTGSRFDSAPGPGSSPPRLVPIKLPDFKGAYAIWGATGRDVRGHIWVGVSATGVAIPSAHLIEYVPETGRARSIGATR